MRILSTAFVLLIQTLQCLALDDSAFQLVNKATGSCLCKTSDYCPYMRWTTGDRIMRSWWNKCIGVQGKTVGSDVALYDCDEKSELQQWECINGTVLALKGQKLYIKLNEDNTAVLSDTIGPNNHLTIQGTTSGACTRTYREYFTIDGNAAGRPCMFPFMYKNDWHTECTTVDSSDNRQWCAVETKYEHELWGYCPTNTKEHWKKHPTTGAYYQLNTKSSLTWSEADASCKQQGGSLLGITDPHEQAYVTALLGSAAGGKGYKLWTGLILDTEHGWQWSNGNPFRYLNWDSGHPLSDPGHHCGIMDGDVEYSWQSSKCNKKLGYICYSKGVLTPATEAPEAGFCPTHWIPYDGHCFYLNRTLNTWSNAQLACRKEGGDLVSIRNLEDQSFVISQLGYASNDELWIGLNDRKTERLFDWSDHSTVRFTSWEYGKPTISSDTTDCALMRGENGNWADRECKEKHGYICMKTSASEPSGDEKDLNIGIGCKTGWKKHGSYCYFVGTQTKTFDEAKEDCKSSGSYMADVSTGVDNAFLVSLVGLRPEKYFWLGLSNQKNIDHFVWTNRESVKFTHWNANMPGHQQGCVAMTTGTFAGLWDVLPCTNKEKYICKHLAEGEALTPVPPTVPSAKCADGWTKSLITNSCFKTYQYGRKTWYEARDYCRAIGGDLVSVHSKAELQLLPRGYRKVWIGLSAPDPVTGYVWSDGSPVNFQHWESGQPDNSQNVEFCVEFQPYRRDLSGSWNDVHCETYNDWICQIRAGVTPKPDPDPVAPEYNMTSDGWRQWNGSQYYINKNSLAMEEARAFCRKNHGDLVTINSEAESVILWKMISQTYRIYWIGLSVDLDRTLQWMDGSPVLFQRWAQGQPDFKNYDENCVAMNNRNGFWHDYNCGFEHGSICKRSTSPPANTTVAPTQPPKGGCKLPWKKFNSKCYSIIKNQKLTWTDARTTCRNMGGDLASISSRLVQVFLMSQMVDTPTTDLWIGLHSIHGGQFLWTDNRPRSYYNLNMNVHRYNPYYLRSRYMRFRYFHDSYEIEYRELENNCFMINTNQSLGIGKWIPKHCNDTNGFVCLRDVEQNLGDSPEPPIPTGYVNILNDSIGVVTQQMNWDAAKMHCESEGGNLASLRNEWTHAHVEMLALRLKTPLWIGLNKDQTGGYFKYIDGWRMTFSRWGGNEPRTNRSCVYVDVDGKWKSAYCNQTYNSVCLTSTYVPPTESTEFPGVCPPDPEASYTGQVTSWLPFRGHCYIFFTREREWPDAFTSCAHHGGTLASIEDPAEQEFIKTNIGIYKDSYTSFWMGLYKNSKGEWLWFDKTVMDYTNWDKAQPGSYSYGEITTSDGTWKTAYKGYDRPYICKAHKVPSPTSSPSPKVGIFDHHRSHIILAVVIIVAGIAVGVVIALFLFKKSGHRLPIPDNFTFDNPLFSKTNQSQPDLVDTQKLVENAEEENTEPIITM